MGTVTFSSLCTCQLQNDLFVFVQEALGKLELILRNI